MGMNISIELPRPLRRKLYLASQVDQESMNKMTKAILDINDSDEELIKLYSVYGMDYKPCPIEIYIDNHRDY